MTVGYCTVFIRMTAWGKKLSLWWLLFANSALWLLHEGLCLRCEGSADFFWPWTCRGLEWREDQHRWSFPESWLSVDCPASWLSWTRQWLVCTGQTGWWQCGRWPAAPVAGWTSWVAAGRTTSAGTSSGQSLHVTVLSNPVKGWIQGSDPGGRGFLRKSTVISTVLSGFSSRWFWLNKWTSWSTSCLSADSSSSGSDQWQWCHLRTSGVLQKGPLRCSHLCIWRRTAVRGRTPGGGRCQYAFMHLWL